MMRERLVQLRTAAMAACFAAVLVGCSSAGPPMNEWDQFGPNAVPDTTKSTSSSDLRVSPLDIVEVKVFGVSELNGDYQVDQEGRIKMPLVGVFEAQGRSTFELAELIETRLGERYLQSPDVVVSLQESFDRQVTIEGSVQAPGMYAVKGELSLLQAIALSGGPNERANPKRVVVFRTIQGERRAAAFNLLEIRRGDAEDPMVYGNDIIVMDGSDVERGYREVLRSVPLAAFILAL
ncbi:MAG: polysaccharide export protein [Caulobacterales bacterium]|nr:polysaccharide export protein [Caulobacterales bacterium]